MICSVATVYLVSFFSSEAKAFLLPLHEVAGEEATASNINWGDVSSEAASSLGNPEVSEMIPSYLPPSPPQSQVFEVVGTCVDSDGHIFGHKVAGIASITTFEKAMIGERFISTSSSQDL